MRVRVTGSDGSDLGLERAAAHPGRLPGRGRVGRHSDRSADAGDRGAARSGPDRVRRGRRRRLGRLLRDRAGGLPGQRQRCRRRRPGPEAGLDALPVAARPRDDRRDRPAGARSERAGTAVRRRLGHRAVRLPRSGGTLLHRAAGGGGPAGDHVRRRPPPGGGHRRELARRTRTAHRQRDLPRRGPRPRRRAAGVGPRRFRRHRLVDGRRRRTPGHPHRAELAGGAPDRGAGCPRGDHHPVRPHGAGLRPEPGRPAPADRRRTGRHGGHPASRRGARARRARHPAAPARQGDRHPHPGRRRTGHLGAGVHLPRLPLRRGRRLAGDPRPRRRHGPGHPQRHGADRLVRQLSRAGGPAARERGLGSAGQLPLRAHRLPAAGRAARVDRRHPGVRPDRLLPLRRARLPGVVADRPGAGAAARRRHRPVRGAERAGGTCPTGRRLGRCGHSRPDGAARALRRRAACWPISWPACRPGPT